MELTDANKEKIETLIGRWGVSLQLLITMEQCSQLSTECSHWMRWSNNQSKLVERMADMQIMIQTLQQVFGVQDAELQNVIDRKLEGALKKE